MTLPDWIQRSDESRAEFEERVRREIQLAASGWTAAPKPATAPDEKVSGRKDAKPEALGFLPPLALMEVARVAGFGAEKYGDPYNYFLGFSWSLSYNALQRHLHAFWARQDRDPDSGLWHLAHAAWHCLALMEFMARFPQWDDRPPERPAP